MPTVAELERLNALTQRLVPLTDARRGEIIRADSWNLVTGALVELARVVLAENTPEVVPTHQHVEEVDVGWLTPRLRALIEQGGLSDPVAGKRLATIERDGQKLKEGLDVLSAEINRMRVNLNDVKLGDIDREADMTILRRKFEAQSDARTEVLDLRKTLDNIRANINRALELGESIAVDGQLPNFGEYQERLAGLESLRERLTNPDGTMLDAGALAIRLAALQNEFVTQEQLDDALADVRNRPPQELVDALQADLQGFVDERLAAVQDDFSARFVNQDEFNSRLESLAADLLGQLNGRIDELLAELEQRFVDRDTFEARLAQLVDELLAKVGEMIQGEVAAQLKQLLPSLDKRYVTQAALEARLDGFFKEIEVRLLERLRAEIDRAVAAAMERQSRFFVPRDEYDKNNEAVWAAIEDLRRRVGGSTGGIRRDPVISPIISPRTTAVDNLIEIIGLGEVYVERLLEQGVNTFAQLAALSDEALAELLQTTVKNIARWNIQAQAAARAQE